VAGSLVMYPPSMHLFGWIGVFVGAGLGLAALVAPVRMLDFVGLAAAAPEGVAEVRATYGGFFFALELGAAALWLTRNATDGILVTGVAWIGAAAGRLLSLALDGRRTARNLQAVVFESCVGLAHLAFVAMPSG
jgi:hypothetical protein